MPGENKMMGRIERHTTLHAGELFIDREELHGSYQHERGSDTASR